MNLKDIKVQVFFTEDSIPRVVNAELTANGIADIEKVCDDFYLGFLTFFHDDCYEIFDSNIYYIRDSEKYQDGYSKQELLEIYKKENGL